MNDYKDIALKVIATMTHLNAIEGKIDNINDDIYVISHGFYCSGYCNQRARDLIAKYIKDFRRKKYDFYYIKKESE